VDFSLNPGEKKIVRFVLSWCSPYWSAGGTLIAKGNVFRHMYANHYPKPDETAKLLASKHSSLLKRVLDWQQVVYSENSLPIWLRESLVNIFHLISEDGLWATARPPIPDWCRQEDGLFGMLESPRECPQIECLPCSFYGNIPLVYFFPKLALSSLRGYKGYQYPEGTAPWVFGGVTGGTGPCEMAAPTRGYQTVLNGSCYVDMVDRYWRRSGDQEFIKEFYPSVKKNTIFTMNLRPEYSVGDRIISMPSGNVGSEWFEGEEWAGMVPHIGGIHLANVKMAKRMAEAVGDEEFVKQCQEWFEAGSRSLEEKLWAGKYYLTFWEPESGKKSDLIFAFQLDGEWMSNFHGLGSVFRPERARLTLETIKNNNVKLTKYGAVNFTRPDGSPAYGVGYGPYNTMTCALLILSMNYMYEGQRDFGLELARRHWENLVCKRGYTWDQPNFYFGDADTGERVYGSDYYQNMLLWALPAAAKGEDLAATIHPGGLVDRIMQAARGK
jgi:uncharacterized protein (DUF608 family)